MGLSLAFGILMTISFFTIIAGHAVDVQDFPWQEVSRSGTKHHYSADPGNGGYEYVGTVYPFNDRIHFRGECFQQNTAYLKESPYSLWNRVVIEARSAKSWACTDYYEFKVGDQSLGTKSISIGLLSRDFEIYNLDKELWERIRAQGVAIYIYRENGVSKEAEVQPLLTGGASNAEFLKKQMELPLKMKNVKRAK
ncbi:uncharacterized protein LOC8267564 [Ricinus communis]|uniref:Uncharacterized protein n=1 Tax=Ricinus communis TaxID=3988 RepID=B9SQ85_RICCO|nr:uncharacterized protein LOC8267564 [Ricinus communis]EEF34245.1 conserved hypothetical protein [Ricinus communis]|eukprot:XP_002528154.1 uncharacterized protein LOC8267564 [Ricinus communis]